METLRVGVIGLGRMGQRHCRVYNNLRQVQLAGVYDSRPEVVADTARRYEVPGYLDLDEMLAKVEAVSLVTPTPTHLEVAERCLARGIHVLVEKPLAESVERAEQLAQLADDSGRCVQVGHIERFNPAFIELKNVLENNEVLAINVRRLSAYESSNADVDVILDLMIHDFDLVLNMMGGKPSDIIAMGLSARGPSVDHAVVQMRYAHGPLVSLTASRVTEQKVRSIEVTAADAYVECDLLNKTIAVHRSSIGEYLTNNRQGVKYRQESIVERLAVPAFEPLFLELQSFVDSIRSGRPAAVTAQDGLRAMQMAQTAREALGLYPVDFEFRPLPAMPQPQFAGL